MERRYVASPEGQKTPEEGVTQEERIRALEEDYQRQSKTLRLSQLNTAPVAPPKEVERFASPKAFQLTQADNLGSLAEIISSKDLLLVRCKNTIEELQQSLQRERHISL
jgi:hypothetical protein